MHVIRSVSLSRYLISIAALALLAGLLLLPDQAQAQTVPTISGMGSLTFAENTPTTMVLATYTADDTDGSTSFTWSLEGVDADDFTIDAGELKFANVPNFEMPADTPSTDQSVGDNVYNVTVKVADNESTPMSATLPVTVTVTNVDEPGTVAITGSRRGGGQLMATVSDLDGTPTNVTWQWARGASTGGPFVDISGATFASYSVLADDVNNYLQITASYTDPEGMGKSATALTGRVVAGNTKPYFSSDTATRTLPENSAAGVNVVGGVVMATDVDQANDYTFDTLTYTLTGTDAGSFEIDAIDATDLGVDQGVQIKTKTGTSHNFNFEATKKIYTVTVNVRDSKDSAGYADTEVDDIIVVTITLTNVDEPGTVTITGTLSGGEQLTAAVTDIDGTVSGLTWQWARGRHGHRVLREHQRGNLRGLYDWSRQTWASTCRPRRVTPTPRVRASPPKL